MSKMYSGTISADFIGWKAYKGIAKKAMDKEFSWSGLIVSLSIAFFIVIIGSYALSMVYQAVEKKVGFPALYPRVYYLEDFRHTNFSEATEIDFDILKFA